MDHNHSYKLLFSHREMMADLLQGFVTAEWGQTVDLTTLERVYSSHVSDDLRDFVLGNHARHALALAVPV